ncbi:hypothetical protein G7Y79_00001g003060 [Physcia stellaris]|nr:hypothetical protein G7Y79_00001g003060 [Physcia stellaris]
MTGGDFDLALSTIWFTKTPPALPPAIRAAGTTAHTYSWTTEQSYKGISKTLIVAIRFTDTLATTKLLLSWESSNPASTVKAQQKHYPAPSALSEEDLLKASKTYGENIAKWAEDSVGTRVGDGECWTLIHNALSDIADTYRTVGQVPPLVSQGRTHGVMILSVSGASPGSNGGMLQLADVRRGDILELNGAHFRILEAAGDMQKPMFKPGSMVSEPIKGGGERNIRMARHTAIVVGVDGDTVKVVEQNGSTVGGVGAERYGLDTMQGGEMQIWRVVGETYLGALEAVWED